MYYVRSKGHRKTTFSFFPGMQFFLKILTDFRREESCYEELLYMTFST